MTQPEAAFVLKLKKLLAGMPKSLELIVRNNCLDVCEFGAREKYFNATGHADGVPVLADIDTRKLRIYPGGESL